MISLKIAVDVLMHYSLVLAGYVPERPLPKKAVEKSANEEKPLIPPNSMIGQFTAVLGTTVLGMASLG